MGALTEQEIFSTMAENFRLAEQYSRDLAILPAKGPTYHKFRTCLKLIEGCCRQAAYWRENTHWLQIGLQMAEAHKRAGFWLRRKHPSRLFLMLADNLRAGYFAAERLRTAKHGRMGVILPEAPTPFRETRQHRVELPGEFVQRDSGLIVPTTAQ